MNTSKMRVAIKGTPLQKVFEVELKDLGHFVEILIDGVRVAEIVATNDELPSMDIAHGAHTKLSSIGNFSQLILRKVRD